jgi:dTDP-4-dehydrorhamnose reductase
LGLGGQTKKGMPTMKIMITGANGQLGNALCKAMENVPGITLLATTKNSLDVTNKNAVDMYLLTHKPDLVINSAAFTDVDTAEIEPITANAVNHLGALYLAVASAKINATIIQLSTDFVFSGDKLTPYTELDAAHPINCYGKTKLDGELAVINNSPKHLIIRTSWLFSECGNNFYTKIRNKVLHEKSLAVVNDQLGSPTYVGDLVNFIVKIIHHLAGNAKTAWGIYHYAGNPLVSRFDFARSIQTSLVHLTNRYVIAPTVSAEYKSPAQRPRNSSLCSDKACDYFHVESSDWAAGLSTIARKVKDPL